jgi:hypothetical protein
MAGRGPGGWTPGKEEQQQQAAAVVQGVKDEGTVAQHLDSANEGLLGGARLLHMSCDSYRHALCPARTRFIVCWVCCSSTAEQHLAVLQTLSAKTPKG